MKAKLILMLVLVSCTLDLHAFYNPSTGRWLSRDPIGERGGLNLYATFLNGPTISVDRNGHDNWSSPSIGGAHQNLVNIVSYPILPSPENPDELILPNLPPGEDQYDLNGDGVITPAENAEAIEGAWQGTDSWIGDAVLFGVANCFRGGCCRAAAARPSAAEVADLVQIHGLRLSRKAFQALKEDIAKNGIKTPIEYVECEGKKYVVYGHHRLRAAKELGLKQVPAKEVCLPYNKNIRTVEDLFNWER